MINVIPCHKEQPRLSNGIHGILCHVMDGHDCLITCLSVNTGPFANGRNNYTFLDKEIPDFYKYFIVCNKIIT